MGFDFDGVAAAWDRGFAIRENAAHAVSERLVSAARIGAGARVLDIGTGPGEPALTAARAAGESGHVVGIDVSPAMVQLAGLRAERAGLANVEFIVSDGFSNVPPGPYDAVVSRWGLMFFSDIDAAFWDLFALLKPGAGFATATWAKPHDVPLIALPLAHMAAIDGVAFDPASGPFALADDIYLIQRLSDAGFVDVTVETQAVVYEFCSAAEYVEHVSETIPAIAARLAKVDASARAAFRETLESAVRAHFEQTNGAIRITNHAIVASATRPVEGVREAVVLQA